MPKTRFILHVGLPKCASSALQSHFWTHRSWLAERGFQYPEPVASAIIPKHQYLVSDLLHNGIDFNAIDKLRQTAGCVLLSCEGLTNHLYDFPEQNLRDAAAYFSQFDATGLMLHRPTKSWIRSYYVQCTLNPPSRLTALYATTLRLNEFHALERVRKLSRHEDVATDVGKALGMSSICCIDPGENLLESLAEELGIPAPDGAQLVRSNVSPPGHVVEIIRQINGLAETAGNRASWLGAVQAWAGTGNTLMRIYASNASYEKIRRLNLELLEQLTPEQDDHFGLTRDEIDNFKDWFCQLNQDKWDSLHG